MALCCGDTQHVFVFVFLCVYLACKIVSNGSQLDVQPHLKKTSRGKKLCICIFIKTILGLEKVHDIHTYIFLLRSNRTPKREIFIALSPDYPGIALVILKKLLLMAEILHHLGCCKWWDKLPINWCRISSINSGDPNHSEWKIELHHCRSQIL